MEISNFSQKITKDEWDNHIDYLDKLPDIISTKEKTYLSLKEHISKNVQGKNFGILLSGGIDSSLIAAKSDFSTVTNEYELSAELEAFDLTSQKLADFLLPSFHRYWERGAAQVTVEKAPDAPPMSMTDM